ncbi:hypothetical protein, partial [Methylomonas methanica]|uniref:hypothetical protein n=1 Tax=Methylomonas methanica TaxID=421 RepID=UPI001E557D92
ANQSIFFINPQQHRASLLQRLIVIRPVLGAVFLRLWLGHTSWGLVNSLVTWGCCLFMQQSRKKAVDESIRRFFMPAVMSIAGKEIAGACKTHVPAI